VHGSTLAVFLQVEWLSQDSWLNHSTLRSAWVSRFLRVTAAGLRISRFALHLKQYASMTSVGIVRV